jgi:DnaK suppressor protein
MHVATGMHFDHRIKDALVERHRALQGRYRDEVVRADEELGSPDIERVGNAADRYDALVLLRLGDVDARALQEVAAAIERFDDGGYGRCVRCSRGIDPKRLKALPAVALCFTCAARAEAAS